jgi:hypothetical protein
MKRVRVKSAAAAAAVVATVAVVAVADAATTAAAVVVVVDVATTVAEVAADAATDPAVSIPQNVETPRCKPGRFCWESECAEGHSLSGDAAG